MKLIIAGGRNYQLSQWDLAELENLRLSRFIEPITEVISGGATGADAAGEQWARGHSIPVRRFPADWSKHGKSAGPIRNAHARNR